MSWTSVVELSAGKKQIDLKIDSEGASPLAGLGQPTL